MVGAEHKLDRKPRGLGRVKVMGGGAVYGCTGCSWVAAGRLVDVIRQHYTHVQSLPDEREQRLAEIAAEMAELEAQLAALTGG